MDAMAQDTWSSFLRSPAGQKYADQPTDSLCAMAHQVVFDWVGWAEAEKVQGKGAEQGTGGASSQKTSSSTSTTGVLQAPQALQPFQCFVRDPMSGGARRLQVPQLAKDPLTWDNFYKEMSPRVTAFASRPQVQGLFNKALNVIQPGMLKEHALSISATSICEHLLVAIAGDLLSTDREGCNIHFNDIVCDRNGGYWYAKVSRAHSTHTRAPSFFTIQVRPHRSLTDPWQFSIPMVLYTKGDISEEEAHINLHGFAGFQEFMQICGDVVVYHVLRGMVCVHLLWRLLSVLGSH